MFSKTWVGFFYSEWKENETDHWVKSKWNTMKNTKVSVRYKPLSPGSQSSLSNLQTGSWKWDRCVWAANISNENRVTQVASSKMALYYTLGWEHIGLEQVIVLGIHSEPVGVVSYHPLPKLKGLFPAVILQKIPCCVKQGGPQIWDFYFVILPLYTSMVVFKTINYSYFYT